MTYADEVEVRRPPSVGTKVMLFGFAILAILGSFWSIVWFIRAYVEAPRVSIPAPMTLAASETRSVPPPAVRAAPPPTAAAAQASVVPPAPPGAALAQVDAPTASVADRWAPVNQLANPAPATAPMASTAAATPPSPSADPTPAPTLAAPTPTYGAPAPTLGAPAPTLGAPAALATADADPDDVMEGNVPAIAGPAPLPRRRPALAAVAKRNTDPPLPRPRPDGSATPSVWSAVPSSDDRYPGQ